MKKSTLLILASALVSGQVLATTPGTDVIYGDDNRMDVFESRNSAYVEMSRSTAAMIDPANLRMKAGVVEIVSKTLRDRGICAKERFSHQMSAANCSGFLIADNVLVTAGHCIKTEADCRTQKWVFDYRVEAPGQTSVTVHPSSVYSCSKILTRALDTGTKDDFAVIQLDRKADRRPFPFRRSGRITPGTPILVIGHPSGLPTKIADGANVRSLNQKFFTANLDTYGGNSGSAVINAQSGEVEGILVRGENDYVNDPAQGCKVSFRCANNACRGEDVTYISNIPGLMRNIR